MSLQEFIDQNSGKTDVGDTDSNKGQCVGLIEVWTDSLGLSHTWGNADDLLANASGDFKVIYNSPNNFPSPGDIICWEAGWGGSPVGHTAIVVSANNSSLTVFEQNDRIGGGNGACRTYTFNTYNGVQGWMHPNILDNPAPGDNEVEKDVKIAELVSTLKNSVSQVTADEGVIAELHTKIDELVSTLTTATNQETTYEKELEKLKGGTQTMPPIVITPIPSDSSPTDPTPVKPGNKSSEFYLVIAGMIITFLNSKLHLNIPQDQVLGFLVTIVTYVAGRSYVKAKA